MTTSKVLTKRFFFATNRLWPVTGLGLACLFCGGGQGQTPSARTASDRGGDSKAIKLASGSNVLEVDREARAAAIADSLGTLDFPETGARVDRAGKLRPRVRR